MIYEMTNAYPQNLEGCKDGYSYSLLQINSNTLTYKLTDPNGAIKLVKVDELGLDQLIGDPKSVWFSLQS